MTSRKPIVDVAFELISDDQLASKAEAIREDSPRSAGVYNSMLVKMKGYSNSFNFYSLKEHPSSRTIFVIEKALSRATMAVYCPVEDEPHFLKALSETALIDWSEKLGRFRYVPETLVKELDRVLRRKSGEGVRKLVGDLFVYDPSADTGKLVVPAGFVLKRMGAAAVEQMHDFWRYREWSKVRTFLELCKRAPNAAAYRSDSAQEEEVDVQADGLPVAADDDTAVAWACSTEYGPMGLLGVDSSIKDAEVKADLERAVVRACAQLMIKDKFVVHSYLENDETAIRAMKGWTKQGSGTWMWCFDFTDLVLLRHERGLN